MTDSIESTTGKHRSNRRRFAPAALVAGVAASAALALSMSGTLAAFTAQITNSVNTTTTGTLSMQETQTVGGTTTTCNSNDGVTTNNAATCATINKYGGSTTMIPGTPISTTVTIKNTGSVTAKTFTLSPGTCSSSKASTVAGSATDLCSKITLGLTEQVGTGTATTVAAASGTLAAASGKTIALSTLAPGASATYVFTVTLDAAADNTYQNLTASQPLVWNFTS